MVLISVLLISLLILTEDANEVKDIVILLVGDFTLDFIEINLALEKILSIFTLVEAFENFDVLIKMSF